MKSLVLACAVSCVAASTFTPGYVTLSALKSRSDEASAVIQGELERTGLVQVKEIPGLKQVRERVLAASVKCSHVSMAARSAVFDDDVVRRTLATDLANPFVHGQAADEACAQFDTASDELNQIVSTVSKMFVSYLSELFPLGDSFSADDEIKDYASFEQVVENGKHLDHYHSYMVKSGSSVSTTGVSTHDFHTDQGLFIAFVPALMVSEQSKIVAQSTGKFIVKMRDGKTAEANFSDEGNVLVFMMGDGVNQVINDRLKDQRIPLRAAPHAFEVPDADKDVWRSWFGRMYFLPDFVVKAQREASKELAVGCSGNQIARDLQDEEECGMDQIYCWHRCMNFTEEVNPEACEEQGLELKCTSQYNQVWTPADGHGDYNPMCTNATDGITFAPTIPSADLSECEATIVNTIETLKEVHDGHKELAEGLHLFWSIAENGFLAGELFYEGLLGWLAVGLPHPTGGLNGMLGAKVLMGIVDQGGLDGSVEEYEIHPFLTAFRHWSTPLNSSVEDSGLVIDGNCTTSMNFVTNSFGGQEFDVNVPTKIIFAAHTSTWLVGYHGRDLRGVFEIYFDQPDGENTREQKRENTAGTTAGSLALATLLAYML